MRSLTILSGIVIVIINVLIKKTIRRLASWLRFKTMSEMQAVITKYVSYAQFVNTAIITLVINLRYRTFVPS